MMFQTVTSHIVHVLEYFDMNHSVFYDPSLLGTYSSPVSLTMLKVYMSIILCFQALLIRMVILVLNYLSRKVRDPIKTL